MGTNRRKKNKNIKLCVAIYPAASHAIIWVISICCTGASFHGAKQCGKNIRTKQYLHVFTCIYENMFKYKVAALCIPNVIGHTCAEGQPCNVCPIKINTKIKAIVSSSVSSSLCFFFFAFMCIYSFCQAPCFHLERNCSKWWQLRGQSRATISQVAFMKTYADGPGREPTRDVPLMF